MFSLKYFRLLQQAKCTNYKQFCIKPKNQNTICALASGSVRCGVSIVRVSGRNSLPLLLNLTRLSKEPVPRRAYYKDIYHPESGDLIDSGLVLWFPAPRSFTGEDVCEFQVHGSPAVVNALINVLTTFDNVRMADPGEFSRRAFYNNKLDLTEIEGLGDLLQAETEQQRQQALANTKGKLRPVFNKWRSELLKNVAHIEAEIDFAETEDITVNLTAMYSEVKNIRDEMLSYIEESQKGFSLKSGIQTVIYGAPNVGKSSFFNMLCRSNRAIVSEIAGTTRDVLEVTYDIEGYPIVLLDTAGIHQETKDIIEKTGIQKAVEVLESPETYIHILICSVKLYLDYRDRNTINNYLQFLKWYVTSSGLDNLIDENADTITNLFKVKTIVVFNKIDLLEAKELLELQKIDENICFTSCTEQKGLSNFLQKFKEELDLIFAQGKNENPRLTTIRQKSYLTYCTKNLDNFLNKCSNSENTDLVIMAEDLKKGLRNIGFITGHVVNDEILDVIFEHFCVGK